MRPMTEDDWELLLQWNNDPEVLYYSEGDNITESSLDEIQMVYRSISRKAFCFIIDYDRLPVGDCWLQEMNLDRILRHHPGQNVRRIDLAIGEKALWGRGIGTEVLRMLVDFGFDEEGVDVIFGCDIADYNPRSLRAFQKAGFEHYGTVPQPPGAKSRLCYDMVLTRDRHDDTREGEGNDIRVPRI